MNATNRIARLRQRMHAQGIAACVVPSSDPHLSEYLPERWQGREWLSGFTGSAGTLVVTADFAGVWTDSRYWAQAEAELADSGIALMKITGGNLHPHIVWLADNLAAGSSVSVDGKVLSHTIARQMQKAFSQKNISLRADMDLLDEVWPDRPPLPSAPVYAHPDPFCGVSRADKLLSTRAAMRDHGADWHFLSTLDDIAWLFNLRGADIEFNPFFIAHALVGLQDVTLFVPDGKISSSLQEVLARDSVQVAAYDSATDALAALPTHATLLIDPRRTTHSVHSAVPSALNVIEAINPTILSKSRKADAELAHVRATMEQDGAALCDFFAWLESALPAPASSVTEVMVDAHITAARARRPHYVCNSFATIAGFNANGAQPHYRATPEHHARIVGDGLLLIDSGGQYFGGTTDITRTVAIGSPSQAQRRDFTLVLKGAIALLTAQFPHGTRAPLLDALARAPLWAQGLDYGHGTGHGVGYFLSVHEGPQSISFHTPPEPHTALLPGMITSVEPALYRAGQWGVRIENLVATVPAESEGFLRFETLTLCPIDTRCIDAALLTVEEIAWLDTYHATVRARLLPQVAGAAKDWLIASTNPLASVPSARK